MVCSWTKGRFLGQWRRTFLLCMATNGEAEDDWPVLKHEALGCRPGVKLLTTGSLGQGRRTFSLGVATNGEAEDE